MDGHLTSSRADCPALPKQKQAKLRVIYDFSAAGSGSVPLL
jgi:hypothetical protein